MKRSVHCAHGIPIRDCAEHWQEFDAATTPPKSTPEGVAEILDKLLAVYGVPAHYPNDSKDRALQALHDLYTQRFREAIGEDYVFERPKDDYLPNVYIHLKAKNELRAEAIKRWEELSKGDAA